MPSVYLYIESSYPLLLLKYVVIFCLYKYYVLNAIYYILQTLYIILYITFNTITTKELLTRNHLLTCLSKVPHIKNTSYTTLSIQLNNLSYIVNLHDHNSIFRNTLK